MVAPGSVSAVNAVLIDVATEIYMFGLVCVLNIGKTLFNDRRTFM